MTASNIIKILGIVSVVATGLIVVGCEFGQPPPEATVRPVICNGQPDWCVVVKSELDTHFPAYVYVDGKMAGIILASQTLRFPVQSGLTHYIHFCAPTGADRQMKCSTPTAAKFDSGDEALAVFPLD